MFVITPIGHFIRLVRIRDCVPSVAKPHPLMVKNHHKITAEQRTFGTAATLTITRVALG